MQTCIVQNIKIREMYNLSLNMCTFDTLLEICNHQICKAIQKINKLIILEKCFIKENIEWCHLLLIYQCHQCFILDERE